jgi:hypothetical protein
MRKEEKGKWNKRYWESILENVSNMENNNLFFLFCLWVCVTHTHTHTNQKNNNESSYSFDCFLFVLNLFFIEFFFSISSFNIWLYLIFISNSFF